MKRAGMQWDEKLEPEPLPMLSKKGLRHIKNGGVEKSLDDLFPNSKEFDTHRYPLCKKGSNAIGTCKNCGGPRYKFRGIQRGLCKKCLEQEHSDENKELLKIAVKRMRVK